MYTPLLTLELYNAIPYVHVGYITVPYTEDNIRHASILADLCSKVNLKVKHTENRTKRLPVLTLNSTDQLTRLLNSDAVYRLRILTYFYFERPSYVRRKTIIRNNFPHLRYILY